MDRNRGEFRISFVRNNRKPMGHEPQRNLDGICFRDNRPRYSAIIQRAPSERRVRFRFDDC